MYIIEIRIEKWNILAISFNWVVIAVIILFILGIFIITKQLGLYVNKQSIDVDEINLGIGNNSVKLSYCRKDQEIAYKIWVELITRKIGIPFDKEYDVVIEIYNSWYEFFKITRELLKELPVNKIASSNELILLTEKVLNNGLRPHLTKWQAQYREWYSIALEEGKHMSPQDLQKSFPYYNDLIIDLIATNNRMINYKELMYKIAFKSYIHSIIQGDILLSM